MTGDLDEVALTEAMAEIRATLPPPTDEQWLAWYVGVGRAARRFYAERRSESARKGWATRRKKKGNAR